MQPRQQKTLGAAWGSSPGWSIAEIGGFSLTGGAGFSCPKAGTGEGAGVWFSSPWAQATLAASRLSVRVK